MGLGEGFGEVFETYTSCCQSRVFSVFLGSQKPVRLPGKEHCPTIALMEFVLVAEADYIVSRTRAGLLTRPSCRGGTGLGRMYLETRIVR